jgi:hypothetical protein
MYERLIYPSKIEMEGTRQLLITNFPLVKLWDVSDPIASYVTDMELSITEPQFFRWALRDSGIGIPVIHYCLNLTVALYEPPAWMTAILREMKPDWKLLGN